MDLSNRLAAVDYSNFEPLLYTDDGVVKLDARRRNEDVFHSSLKSVSRQKQQNPISIQIAKDPKRIRNLHMLAIFVIGCYHNSWAGSSAS